MASISTHTNDVNTKNTVDKGNEPCATIGRPDNANEILKFPTECPSCHANTETCMHITDIPHFKEIILMTTSCEHCGYKSNEIKPGGAVSEYATKINLVVGGPSDLKREVIKSDSAGIEVPDVDLILGEGGLGGMFTTVEGLLGRIYDRLSSSNLRLVGDDVRYALFLEKLCDMKEGRLFPFSIVITDPLSNSYVGPTPEVAAKLSKQAEIEGRDDCYNNFVDRGMKIETYERSFDQNEALGLNDMKTELCQNKGENYQYKQTNMNLKEGNDRMDEQSAKSAQAESLRFRRVDHPHSVAKGSSESDDTIMGQNGTSYPTPEIIQNDGLTLNKL